MKKFSRNGLIGVLFLLSAYFSDATLQAAHKGLAPGETRITKKDSMIKVFVPVPVKAQSEATFKLVIRSLYPWKINRKFPVKVDLDAGKGVTLKKSVLKKGDAASIENERIVFFVPFSVVAAGKFKINLKLNFSVCKEDSCHSYWGSSAVAATISGIAAPAE